MAVIVYIYIYCGQMSFVVKITRQSCYQAVVVCGGESVGGGGANGCFNAAPLACVGGGGVCGRGGSES